MPTTDGRGVQAIRSVDYIIIMCDELEPMRSFYSNVLDFTIHEEDPGLFVGFQIGTLWFGLRPRGRGYDGPAVPHESAAIQLSFRVPPADVDLAYERLQEHTVEVIEGPTDQDWPHRTLFFRDPENNVLEIFADIHPRDTLAAPSGVHLLT